MANKKTAQVEGPYPMKDYQCEEDVRTLSRAAEVMADTGRKRAALKKFKAQQTGGNKLISVLSSGKPKGY